MSKCCDKKAINNLAEGLKKIPVLRYLKDPVVHLEDLYIKYPQGGEYGWFSFVETKQMFAYWDIETKEWKYLVDLTAINNSITFILQQIDDIHNQLEGFVNIDERLNAIEDNISSINEALDDKVSKSEYESLLELVESIKIYMDHVGNNRCLYFKMESLTSQMFIGETLQLYYVKAFNVASLTIGNDTIAIDELIDYEIPAGSIITVNITKGLTDNESYIYMLATTANEIPQPEPIPDNSIPNNVVVMYSGSVENIPEGWALCNGQIVDGKQTPDMRNRFVVGYNPDNINYNAIGKTGGKDFITLLLANIPSHTHDIKYTNKKWGDNANNRPFNLWNETKNSDYSGRTEATGKDNPDPIDIRPLYYVIAFIIKL
ncbi:MAG: tail fiber protein [Prevotella sp.]|jgi:hypothetical protein|nr:tail fiber protein [Prevotella sp.]